ncbi:hypothetical protein TNCV_891421 [Trichonephila clavipes]|nr:hypothetical protein TNCV_891421 [Trichonephila clavipes]
MYQIDYELRGIASERVNIQRSATSRNCEGSWQRTTSFPTRVTSAAPELILHSPLFYIIPKANLPSNSRRLMDGTSHPLQYECSLNSFTSDVRFSETIGGGPRNVEPRLRTSWARGNGDGKDKKEKEKYVIPSTHFGNEIGQRSFGSELNWESYSRQPLTEM